MEIQNEKRIFGNTHAHTKKEEKKQVHQIELQHPGPYDVTVEVKSASLNFFDIYVRHGLTVDVHPPCTLGLECAGIIRETGAKVQGLKYGDHVIVHCPEGGAFREFLVTDWSNVLPMPTDVDFDEAATITISYLTAYFTLVELAGIRSGNSVLVQSAAGGVGWAATQIAKMHNNVTVIGVASAQKHSVIKENGVDHAISYDQNLKDEVFSICPQGVSIVLENTSGKSFTESQELLSPLGKVILIGAKQMVAGETRSLLAIIKTWWQTKNVSPYNLIMKNVAVAGFNLNTFRKSRPDKFRQIWEKMARFLGEGKIQPKIDSVFAFEDIHLACQRMVERKNVGKIIVRPNLDKTCKD